MKNYKIGIIGLGYVGLPLAVEFSKKYSTLGFDTNITRINQLKKCTDHTQEVEKSELEKTIINFEKHNFCGLELTNNVYDLKSCNIYIITVPTPIDVDNKPDFSAIKNATISISKLISKNDLIIYESTVYPGATEEICVPIIEEITGFKLNNEFYVGYSPERINPGDKERSLTKILKITSASNQKSATIVDKLYGSIIEAGTYKAKSIRVAEAAKVIENSQRDINIAFVNELAKIFNILGIDTNDVLEAAGTKWNFLKFKPGLVGGHCIGVDPFYLAQKAIDVGYNPNIILSGRKLNDSMAKYVASQLISFLKKEIGIITDAKILILGLTFKENCPDLRNSKVFDILSELSRYNLKMSIYDPWVDSNDLKKYKNLLITNISKTERYDAILLCVAHDAFLNIDYDMIKTEKGFIYDIKGFLKFKVKYRL